MFILSLTSLQITPSLVASLSKAEFERKSKVCTDLKTKVLKIRHCAIKYNENLSILLIDASVGAVIK